MRRPLPHHKTRRPDRPATRTLTVCVVDPQADDYEGCELLAQASGVRLQIVGSAEAALRVARTATVDLWVVNTTLPDLSGIDLCQMLRSGATQPPVYLVSDTHSADIERQAYAAQVSLYGVKPAHGDWIDEWLAHCERQAMVRYG